LTEFTAIGTAVRIPGWQAEPFICALSAQEFWQLHKAGYVPVGIAFGVCAYYIYTDFATQNLLFNWFWGTNANASQEIPLYQAGFQAARGEAINRLTQDIYEHKADGCVGMQIDHHMEDVEYESNNRTYHDMIAHFVALGTTINYKPEQAATDALLSPNLVINLGSSKLKATEFSKLSSMNSTVFQDAIDDDSDLN
jgi:uncharacterized protein YbjQ (UPF0145 family)